MTSPPNDITRLRQEYAHRANRLHGSDKYSPFNLMDLFIRQQRERRLLDMLDSQGLSALSHLFILEVGCGNGGVLLDFLQYGAEPGHITGIDLLHDRLISAELRLPGSEVYCADGQHLPFSSEKFDLVLQFTAFSSVLDPQVKINIASEMLRVLKPDGAILWYDFWWNPTNPQTAGIKPKEINQLFSGCEFVHRKITLAPPIARRVVPISWPFALILESLKIFNSHYIALIKKLSS